jgi:ketopantoate hydroxymethyltransferase
MIRKALAEYKKEVEESSFPGPDHTFSMRKEEAEAI